ncbi:hypothetical protein BX616_008797 [Lobosporangium transversale]|nr:hypothetical protein BX616_008797 [Lobosporangium transversale]
MFNSESLIESVKATTKTTAVTATATPNSTATRKSMNSTFYPTTTTSSPSPTSSFARNYNSYNNYNYNYNYIYTNNNNSLFMSADTQPISTTFPNERQVFHHSLPPHQQIEYQSQLQYKQQYEQQRFVEPMELFTEMNSHYRKSPPMPPISIKIPGQQAPLQIRGSLAISSLQRQQQQIQQQQQRLKAKEKEKERLQQQQSLLKPDSNKYFIRGGVTASSASTSRSSSMIGYRLLRGLSTRFHPHQDHSTTEPIPVVETVAQEYARTIKSLWQMVEDEELAYQIDAAATAARQQQLRIEQQCQAQMATASSLTTSAKTRHNFISFPLHPLHSSKPELLTSVSSSPFFPSSIPSSRSSSSTSSPISSNHSSPRPHPDRVNTQDSDNDKASTIDPERRICREPCCILTKPNSDINSGNKTLSSPLQRQRQTMQPQLDSTSDDYPSWSWNRPSPLIHASNISNYDATSYLPGAGDGGDSDDESNSDEGRERKRRELEELERELMVLGLQGYQDASDGFELEVQQAQHAPQLPGASPAQQQQQQQQQQTTAAVSKSVSQAQSSMQRPYQRRRQNSLTYEERRLQQDTRWQQQITKPMSPTSYKGPKTINYLDGIELDEDSDENEDTVVLAVAHRVSVRHHADWSLQQMGERQQVASWDVTRGVSWTPMPRTQPQLQQQQRKLAPKYSEGPITSGMISAR